MTPRKTAILIRMIRGNDGLQIPLPARCRTAFSTPEFRCRPAASNRLKLLIFRRFLATEGCFSGPKIDFSAVVSGMRRGRLSPDCAGGQVALYLIEQP